MTILIQIYFDGGCRPTNPGNKYGSYEVVLNSDTIQLVSQVELGWGTNNEAEFDMLLLALQFAVSSCADYGYSLYQTSIEVFTDSTIVANRINNRAIGGKGEPAQRMGRLTKCCLHYMDQFSSAITYWQRREANVTRFGH